MRPDAGLLHHLRLLLMTAAAVVAIVSGSISLLSGNLHGIAVVLIGQRMLFHPEDAELIDRAAKLLTDLFKRGSGE